MQLADTSSCETSSIYNCEKHSFLLFNAHSLRLFCHGSSSRLLHSVLPRAIRNLMLFFFRYELKTLAIVKGNCLKVSLGICKTQSSIRSFTLLDDKGRVTLYPLSWEDQKHRQFNLLEIYFQIQNGAAPNICNPYRFDFGLLFTCLSKGLSQFSSLSSPHYKNIR